MPYGTFGPVSRDRRARPGALYLLCWAKTPYEAGRRPGHYLGFAYPGDPDAADPAILAEIALAEMTRLKRYQLTRYQEAGVALRIARHRDGNGSRLMAVIAEAGIEFQVTRVWSGATERTEKALKDSNHRARLCPACYPGTTRGTVIVPRQYRRKYLQATRR